MASAVLAIPTFAPAANTQLPQLTGDPTQTLAQAARELKASLVIGERNFTKQLDNYAKFEFSPELRPQLKEIFGTERPFPLARVPGAAKGQIDYVGKLAAHSYQQPNGTEFSWTEAVLNFTTDKAGRSISSTGSWPSLLLTRPGSSFSVVNMSMTGKQQRAADGVAYGNANFKIGAITVRNLPAQGESREVVRLDGVEVRSDVTRRGAMAEIGYRTSIDAIVVGDEQIDRSNVALRLTKIPPKAMVELDKLLRAQENSKLSEEQQFKLLLQNLEAFGKRAAMAGATLVIDDISAAYRGNVASLKGSIGFQKVVEADFKNYAVLGKKIVARFDVRLPLALMKDVSRVFFARTVNASVPDAEQQIDKGADAMVSVMVGKAITAGFAVMDKDALRSTIEIRNSKLIVNGKEIDAASQLKAFSGKLLSPKATADSAPDLQPEPAAEQ